MNWVGGSRNRLVIKNDAKRQREFFEKKKMQQRLKNLGIPPPKSPESSSCGSMDLVTLFIVNQIAAKKENKADPLKGAVLDSSEGGLNRKRTEPPVLPMSPCSPSQLSFVENQPQYSEEETRRRKHAISQVFKYRQLSPVLESAFSDNSASDYLPSITDPLSPFSSTSPAPSGQGTFTLQLNLQQLSQPQPPQWNTRPEPFSELRDMTDGLPWSCGPNLSLQPSETPTAAGALFRSPVSETAVAGDHARHEDTFSFNQPEGREDNQIEAGHMNEDVFTGFSTETCEREASAFGKRKLKIYLRGEQPVKPSTTQYISFSNGIDRNFSCHEPNDTPLNCCDCSPSFSSRTDYHSSDSSSEEDHSQPSIQACFSDVLSPNLGSQMISLEKQTQPCPLPPTPKHKMSFRDEQNVMENMAFPYNMRSNSQPERSHTAQSDCSDVQRSEPCTCKKTSSLTQDAGTQTADPRPPAQACHAWTQCCFNGDGTTEATGFALFPPPLVLLQHPPTGRQPDTTAQKGAGTHTSPDVTRRRVKRRTKAGSLSGSSVISTDGSGSTETHEATARCSELSPLREI